MSGIPGIGREKLGIETSKFGRFRGNEQTGIAKTGIAGISGNGKLGIGMDTLKLAKAQLLMTRIRTFLNMWWYLLFCDRAKELPRKYDNSISIKYIVDNTVVA
jgi:hypothetical protein